MLSEAVRQRLEGLNRQPMPVVKPRASKPKKKSQPAEAIEIRDLIGRGEQIENSSGKHLRIYIPLEEVWKPCQQHIEQGVGRLLKAVHEEQTTHPEMIALASHFPRSTMFLDLETCGFAGSAIFLIGLLRQTDQGLAIELLFARNYAEERAILESLWMAASENEVLGTFNGKSFDWPMVHDRSTRHLLGCDARYHAAKHSRNSEPKQGSLGIKDPRPELIHFDLLHHARRRWKKQLPNCKLQTLEQFICGRRRADDIPGNRIPDAYHRYVRTGETSEVQSILHHNLLDLVTLLQVSLRVAG